jgi:UDP-N-acetylmuramate dehydrogenase
MELFVGLEHIVRDSEPLGPYTSLGIGGVAEFFAEPTNEVELAQLAKICQENSIPVKLLGGGSNLLVSDHGVPGLVIALSAPEFAKIEVQGQIIRCGGGCKLSHLVSVAVREGFSGPEQLVGIPGTVGGALHGNTTSHGADIGQWTKSARVMLRSGEIVTRDADEMNFAYRQSSLNELAILTADFQCDKEDSAKLTKRLQKLWILRKAKQPVVGDRMAYMFKDQGGVTAESLIDMAGLKGTKVGNVEIYSDNCNFFIAGKGATSRDVLQLLDLVRTKVLQATGTELEVGIETW